MYSVWPKVNNQHGGNIENLKPHTVQLAKTNGYNTVQLILKLHILFSNALTHGCIVK